MINNIWFFIKTKNGFLLKLKPINVTILCKSRTMTCMQVDMTSCRIAQQLFQFIISQVETAQIKILHNAIHINHPL